MLYPQQRQKKKGLSFSHCVCTYSITDLFSSAAFEDWNEYFPFADVMYWEVLSLLSTNSSSSCKSSLEIHHHPGSVQNSRQECHFNVLLYCL